MSVSFEGDVKRNYTNTESNKELITLGEMSGLQLDLSIYRIIVDLLTMGYRSADIYRLLRHIRKHQLKQLGASASKRLSSTE